MKPYFALSMALCLTLMSCSSRSSSSEQSSSSSSDVGKLTNEKAQRALDRFAQQQRGTIKIKGGIHEIPSENIAKADCESNNIHFMRRGEERIVTHPGCTVGFTRYTDGRWVLTRVTLGGFDAVEWKPNIDLN